MIKFRLSIISLVLLTLFTACQKEFESTPEDLQPNSRITMTTTKSDDSLYYDHFFYDGQNRLVKIQDSSNNNTNTRSIAYDKQGKILSVTLNYTGTGHEFFSFVYGIGNRIVQKLGLSWRLDTVVYNAYAYDARGRLIADTTYGYWPKDIFQYVAYSYDNNDNISEKRIYQNVSGVLQLQQTVQMQYDLKTNPYYGLKSVLYFIDNYANGNEHSLSRNNCVSETYSDGTQLTFNYQYNTGGMPVSYSEVDNTDPVPTYHEIFY